MPNEIDKKPKNGWIMFIKAMLTGIIIILAYQHLGRWGLWGFLALIIGMAIFRLVKGRDLYIHALKHVEMAIWKKPLEKDVWDKDELKNTRIKFVWRKKKNEKET